MKKQEALLFKKLAEKRETQWKTTLSDDDFKGTWDSIVEKYADSAHFIWELIQNADDAQASKVLFKVYEDKLVFIHNGKRHFSVTDCDSKEGVRGDINAIVSVARSNKKDSDTIGKFGVGFKSVFEYTNAPEIYDDKFWFKIENYVVPKQLDADYPGRKRGETVFVLKFKSPKHAVEAVKDKLSSLHNPVLFLKNVRRLEWEYKEETHFYCVRVKRNILSEGNVRCMHIQIAKDNQKDDMLLFSRDVRICGQCHEILVGYYLENGWINTQMRPKIYCYFPTEETYGLCFISHAPFLTTDNRCSIKDKKENQQFHKEIQRLAIDALPVIRDVGKEKGRSLVNHLIEHFAKFCRRTKSWWAIPDGKSEYLISFFAEKLSGQKLLLTKNKEYTSAKCAVMAASGDLYKVFTQKQMRTLLGEEYRHGKLLVNFSADVRHYLLENSLVKQFDWEDVANSLTADFVKEQGNAWVDSLYESLPENQLGKFTHAPIILMNKGSWVSAFDESGTPTVFLSNNFDNSFLGLPLVENGFCQKHANTLRKLGVKDADYIGYLKSKLLPKYANRTVTECEALNDFKEIASLYYALEKEKQCEFLSEVKNKFKFKCVDGVYRKANDIYIPKAEIIAYFSHSQDYKPIIDTVFYGGNLFLDKLEFQGKLRILSRDFCESVDSRNLFNRHKTEDLYNIISATDYCLDGYEQAFLSKETSQLIWRSIISDSGWVKKMHMDVSYKVYHGKRKYYDSQTIPSVLATFLRNEKWFFLEEDCI